MAPMRKRGGGKAKSELSLGDLVLAKVQGFPAWPAKVYMFDYRRSFVAPIDIQPFTRESRNKLVARRKGKTIKYFSQAVKEICDRFEELQPKSSDSLKDGSTSSAVSTEIQIELCNDEVVTSPKEESISNSSAGHNKTDVDS